MFSLAATIRNFFGRKKSPAKKSKEAQTRTFSATYFEVDTGKCYGIPAILSQPAEAQQTVMESFAKHLANIPSLPPVWSEIQTSIKRGDSAKKIASTIRRDQGLATEILKAANSAGFNNEKEISDLGQAIVRIGFQAVRGIATHYCTADFSRRWKSPF